MSGRGRAPAWRRAAVILVAGVWLQGCGAPSSPVSGIPLASRTGEAGPHAWLIMMENRSDTEIAGNAQAPYLNRLMQQFASSLNYRALVHSSQPNYIALFSGDLHGVTGNRTVNLGARNLADQLEAAGLTWKVYAQNVPGACFTGESARGGRDGPGTYARKHEPAISFTDISGSPTRCANIQDLTSFDPTAANFEFIVPNLQNDMHDGTTLEGDTFLKGFVPRILATSAWKAGSPLYITWDEGKQGSSNHILTLVIANTVKAGYRSHKPHTHYSLLLTIESWFGLPCLAQSCKASQLSEFFPSFPPAPTSSP